jgi:hypothetical protein
MLKKKKLTGATNDFRVIDPVQKCTWFPKSREALKKLVSRLKKEGYGDKLIIKKGRMSSDRPAKPLLT